MRSRHTSPIVPFALAAVVACHPLVHGATEASSMLQTPPASRMQSLDGAWQFHPAAADVGVGDDSPVAPPDVSGSLWRTVGIPASFSEIYPDNPLFEGAGWFKKTFVAPHEWQGRRVVIHFEAVNHAASVWLNGHLLGRHEDTGLPFEFPVGEILRFGEENELVVLADSTRRDDRMPNGIFTPEKVAAGGGGVGLAWHPPGGIIREVELRSSDPCRIDSLRVIALPGQLSARVRVCNDRPGPVIAQLRFQVQNDRGETVQEFTRDVASVAPGGETTVIGDVAMPDAVAWSPENPALYRLAAELIMDGTPVDSRGVRFGFRSIQARDGQILLNGRPIFLTGFNRHDDSFTRWNCPDPATARADLEQIRRMGGNFVRLCHYPNHPLVLDLCDEIGLMVMEELPLFWWRGKDDGEDVYQALLTGARRHLEKFIARDSNHPSIIMWSVGNEWQTQRPGVIEGVADLIHLARKLDPARLALHVSDHWRNEYEAKDSFAADDVIALTGYPDPPKADWWVEGIERLHSQYPGKPVLLAELGHFDEARQPEAYEAAIGAVRRSDVCGLVVWSWADYVGSREMGSSPATFGVMARDRQPKRKSLELVRRIFAEAQSQFAKAPHESESSNPNKP